MFSQLTDKVVIITGAAQGIGAAIAKVFASAGAHVIVADIAEAEAKQTVEQIAQSGGKALFIKTDIASREAAINLVSSVKDRLGRVDVVIHNAASFKTDAIADMTEECLDLSLNVILKPAFWLSQAALPCFKAQGAGRLIFTSSVTGPRVAMPGMSNYAAAKAGINGFIRATAVELAKDNITVNGVEPGFIKTAAMDLLADEDGLRQLEAGIPTGSMGKPEDIAYAMLFLASDEAGYITGQTIVVDGGSTLVESAALL